MSGSRRHHAPPKDARKRQRRLRDAPPPPVANPDEPMSWSAIRGCAMKKRFPVRQDAKDWSAKRGRTQRAYRCEHCNGWHLTTKRRESQ